MFAKSYHTQNSMLCNKNAENKAWNLKERNLKWRYSLRHKLHKWYKNYTYTLLQRFNNEMVQFCVCFFPGINK